MKYFDIHCHLNLPDYPDLDETIGRMNKVETGTIVVGVDYASSKKAVEAAARHHNVWACIGVHPADNPNEVFDADKYVLMLASKRVVAIGECGMDFYHRKKDEDFERQKKLFLDHINFALEHDLPLMVHARDSYEEVLAILEPLKKEHGAKLRGDIHFYSGTLEEAKRFWAIDFTTSFTGVITFTRDYDEIIKAAPLTMLMSETDAPFATPEPYRGQRNEPAYVVEIADKIADIRGEDHETVQKALVDNACRVFGIVVK